MPTRSLRTILIAAIAVTPLCLMSGVFLSHDVIPKVILLMASAACVLFLLPLWAGGLRVLWREPPGKLFLTLVCAQCFSLLLSTLFSVQPPLSLVGTVWRRFGMLEQGAALIIATAASVAALDSSWRLSLFRAMAVSGGIASSYAIAQYFGADPFLDPKLYTIQIFGGIVRPPATMGHAIYLASWLAPIAVIAVSQAWHETTALWRRIHGATALLASVAILLSGTRGAVLGLLAGLMFMALRMPGSAVFGKRIALAAGGLALVAALFAVSPAGENLRHRLYQWRQDLGGPRTAVWLESPALLLAHPWFGIGPETFAGEFRRIESRALSRAYPDFYHETPHNAFVDAATAEGIPGLLILAGIFWIGWTGRARPGETSASLEAALLTIMVCSLFASFSLVEWMYLWTFSGLSVALRSNAPREAAPAVPAWVQVPVTLIGGMLAITALLLAVPDARNVQLLVAVEEGNAVLATSAFNKAQSWSFGLPGYELWRSREMAALGVALGKQPGRGSEAAAAWSKAMEAASAAEISSEERFSAAFQSSLLAITTGDLTRGEEKAREAIALAPNWYKPHLLLGQVQQAMGRSAEGTSEQQFAKQLGAP